MGHGLAGGDVTPSVHRISGFALDGKHQRPMLLRYFEGQTTR
ncbi:hypothetical protein I547_2084 [Mycobacterium kansasii 824]|uniref:Uncharacterized protein n=1 Tax=Mycobacterium kansasii TaxID=1768 RepID=A0A1V3WPM8_MYCKA|nr:hypothetical protein I547_2084 [Mycobacterium kansasii 824]OOK68930.1 hypothetical protein BZL30_7008 [Mycobacterium kansasii]